MMLPSPFQTEGSVFPLPLPAAFEHFYRSNLRRRSGSRVRTSVLLDLYQSWAAPNDEGAANFVDLAAWMRFVGHPKRNRNGMYFADVVLAIDAPSLVDSFHVVPACERLSVVTTEQVLAMLDHVDAQMRVIMRATAADMVEGTS